MVVSAVIAVVLVIGSGAGYVGYKLNQPDRQWVPLLLNPELPEEKREQAAEELKDQLLTPERLKAVVRDVDLVKALRAASEDAAVRELERRIFVTVGEAESPGGVVPALHIGVSGKRSERDMLGKTATRLVEDVKEIIEVAAQPPPPDEF